MAERYGLEPQRGIDTTLNITYNVFCKSAVRLRKREEMSHTFYHRPGGYPPQTTKQGGRRAQMDARSTKAPPEPALDPTIEHEPEGDPHIEFGRMALSQMAAERRRQRPIRRTK